MTHTPKHKFISVHRSHHQTLHCTATLLLFFTTEKPLVAQILQKLHNLFYYYYFFLPSVSMFPREVLLLLLLLLLLLFGGTVKTCVGADIILTQEIKAYRLCMSVVQPLRDGPI